MDNSSAEEAGLKENDVITSVNGVSVNTSAELQEQVGQLRPGDKASVTFLRKGVEKTVPIIMKNIAGNTNIVTADNGPLSVFGAKLEPLGSSEKRSLNVDYGVKITELSDGKFKDIGTAERQL